jgi:hypothetical protein
MDGDQRRRWETYPLLDALRQRRSRRFGLGMRIDDGPFAYASEREPVPLSEDEEAVLAFAACGITGYALADLAYGPGQGGTMLGGLVGRTVASPDAINTASLVVTNDHGTWLLRRPQDLAAEDVGEVIDLAQRGELTKLYRRCRVELAGGRSAMRLDPGAGYNFNINRWSLYAPGGTYLLPVSEMTRLYINALLEVFEPPMSVLLLDERAQLRPAGLGRFARGPDRLGAGGRVATIQAIESALAQGLAVEQGMMLQTVGLAAQALGLGGFPNFALHESGWFEALGFRMGSLPASRYLGVGALVRTALRALRRDAPVAYPLGLERDGEVLLAPYCPPAYPSMAAAVEAVLATKFGPVGAFRGGATASAWRDPEAAGGAIAPPSARAVDATVAYCEYVYERYGRFPAYFAPFRTVLGFQATHVDEDFYGRFFRPEALSDTQRGHLAAWHPDAAADR